VRPSLERILPADNLRAMDEFNQALNQYALSKGIGAGAGMGGRFLAIRQLFGAVGMVTGVAHGNPAAFLTGAAFTFGPRAWMELATRPEAIRAATRALKLGAASTQLRPSRQASTRNTMSAETSSISTIPTGTPAPDSTPTSATPQQDKRPQGFQWSWKRGVPEQPPLSLWDGRQRKILTLQMENGPPQRWKLVDGKPKQVN